MVSRSPATSAATPTATSAATPDWSRLQKALAVEADRGFNDLVGKQAHFSEFLQQQLSQPPTALFTAAECDRWHQLAQRFAAYTDLSYADRQHLVAETRRTLHQMRKLQLERQEQQLSLTQVAPVTTASQAISQQATSPESSSTLRVREASRSAIAAPQTIPIVQAQATTERIPELEQDVTYLKGIGPSAAEKLNRLGLYTVRDLLFYYPRDHLDYARQVSIRDLKEGEMATIMATVKRVNCFTSPRKTKLTIFELTVRDRTGQLRLSRFYAGNRYSNRGWQERQKKLYPVGAAIAASGLVKKNRYGLTLDDPQIEVLESQTSQTDSFKVGRVMPVYPLTDGVGADLVRRAVVAALPASQTLVDPLPDSLREQYQLWPLAIALQHIHFPDSSEHLAQARRRLVFDEFFYLQLGLLQRRSERQTQQTSIVLAPQGELIEQFYQVLPFQLTQAQQRVLGEIMADMQRSTPMNRLVQGDVGSGKTVVAVIALLMAIQAGYQGALMAPTEVLAEQHYQKLVSWFNLLHLTVELLTGSIRAAKRREIHRSLETGELPLLVGTHALIQDPVQFSRLGLVVIDEQHRFGVEQRAKLQQKGDNPHVLTMTATPIPRTLALSLHGDLDVSQIDELPPGRQAIKTTALSGNQRNHAYDLMRREIAQGRQVYVVLPLVEESEKLDLKSAIDEHTHLNDGVFPEFQVGLLHGRLTSAEKEQAIQQFRERQTQILVSTTVVEVGVDIPNATVMLIEHAERFGLSQLHQLRGRVGRGAAQSYCLLMSTSKTDTALQRLKVLEQSQDGFFISEMDLRFRGPGEVLGKRQSGLPDFALASLVEDQAVLDLARTAAETAIAQDAKLDRWPAMQAELKYRYYKLMGGAILT
ncbi:MAG: ATP-dependent DNA helicase RecG [Cyanobacteria bacterium P01_H01_bin.121]